ncbi:hypothetical protein DJ71_18505 [Halorubrum sp. E3]|nr:hypothetical protein DJ71_18505 [Halorubrum sp. E3]
MTRGTITLPQELIDELDTYRPEDTPRPQFFREVVLPALAGDNVEIVVDGVLEDEVVDRLDEVEGRIDDLASSLPADTAAEVQKQMR